MEFVKRMDLVALLCIPSLHELCISKFPGLQLQKYVPGKLTQILLASVQGDNGRHSLTSGRKTIIKRSVDVTNH